jgi:hypothetical protein
MGIFGRGGPIGDAAAELGLVSVSAVGIERALELFWEVMGQLKNTWWPLGVPARQLDKFVSSLNQAVKPYQECANDVLTRAATAAGKLPQDLVDAQAILEQVKGYLADLSVANPPSQATAATIIAGIDSLQASKYAVASAVAKGVKGTVADLSSFANSFTNNPARKLISIHAGAIMGVMLAGLTGMDLFAASGFKSTWLGFHWGLVLTGVVMGLGSNPTHDVIKAAQEYKNHQRKLVAG